jgi:hypothetical protein
MVIGGRIFHRAREGVERGAAQVELEVSAGVCQRQAHVGGTVWQGDIEVAEDDARRIDAGARRDLDDLEGAR